ncbi:MAG: DUF1344 domain-containing protein [Candidatus Rokubacteria bacterium]|nr:DUF1344 domain-containing protein [Candidatus Rokubacteria bacterium]
MQKVFAVALALLLALSVASAWAEEIEGKIQKVDPADRMFVLEDGTQLWVAEGLSMDTLKAGASVKATYEERDGKKISTSFAVSE